MTVLITGGTGFVGKALMNQFRSQGIVAHAVSHHDSATFSGELFPSELMSKASKIINLAGESIAGRRWNSNVREEILHSRVKMTRRIVASIQRNHEQNLPYPKVLISASAIGYYGTHPSHTFTEDDNNGDDFLSNVCHLWEQEAIIAASFGVRVVRLRFGHILESDGGMLPRVALPFHFGVGGHLGDGQQWMSWIHRKDLIRIILQSLEQTRWQGVYNVTSPHSVTMKEFMEKLGHVMGSKSRVSVPSFIAKLLFGEMAQEVLLKGQKVFPQRLLEQGYIFQYPDLTDTLMDIYHK